MRGCHLHDTSGWFPAQADRMVKEVEGFCLVRCGDMAVGYVRDPVSGRVELQLLPTRLVSRRAVRRRDLHDAPEVSLLPESWRPFPSCVADSLVHFKCVGDASGSGFSGGVTMRHSASMDRLRCGKPKVVESAEGISITTKLTASNRLVFQHVVSWTRGSQALKITTTCRNAGKEPIELELLSSFSLGGLTPFDSADASDRLVLHRFRSAWSAEAKPSSDTIEALHLERSWTGHSQLSHRFGQVGSMPVRGYFPFAAVEDAKAGVTWAAQLACPGSWQMELYRRGDTISLGGGLADREFGHWTRVLQPGESIDSPEAMVTVAQGGPDDVCRRLVHWQRAHWQAETQPKGEDALPIVFNEWCSNWGATTHDKLIDLAEKLRGTPVKYLVIDDGWTIRKPGGGQSNGDWLVDRQKFPKGLRETCDAVRARGLVPGIWFEFETCTKGTKAHGQTDLLLKRDGHVLDAGGRRFWDFRDARVHRYLEHRVIDLLRDCDFGYLKVDYNETIGIGCDTPHGSLGEGLRENLEGVQEFWRKIRHELPKLVIENCASGGHRLEPSMMALSAMSSFSDAHETTEIPLIAGYLHHLMLPRQLQIWAVLREGDDLRRLNFSLAATFLGRMALSGDILALKPEQWTTVLASMTFYREAHIVIRDGVSRRYGTHPTSFRHPSGWQAIVLQTKSEILVVVHSFESEPPKEIYVPLPKGSWEKSTGFGVEGAKLGLQAGGITIRNLQPCSGMGLLLRRTSRRRRQLDT